MSNNPMADGKMQSIHEMLEERLRLLPPLLEQCKGMPQIEQAADTIFQALHTGHRLTACGNGGNFANADHLIGEFIGRFRWNRKAYPAFAMTGGSLFTAIANDYGFDQVYARQVSGMLQAGDVLVGYSTSGNSVNVIEAVRVARQMGVKTIGFSGSKGKLKDEVGIAIAVPTDHGPVVEEMHYIITHMICEMAEDKLCAQDPDAHRKQ